MPNSDINKHIEKALVVSTTHIRAQTDIWLQLQEQSAENLVVYKKEGGYFVYTDYVIGSEEVPEELLSLIEKAKELECCWLVLDNAALELSGFPTFDWSVDFITTCPYCKAKNSLHVVRGTFVCESMPLREDGFSFVDAKNFYTDNERVCCDSCERIFSLEEVTL